MVKIFSYIREKLKNTFMKFYYLMKLCFKILKFFHLKIYYMKISNMKINLRYTILLNCRVKSTVISGVIMQLYCVCCYNFYVLLSLHGIIAEIIAVI